MVTNQDRADDTQRRQSVISPNHTHPPNNHFKPTESYPTQGPARMRRALYSPSTHHLQLASLITAHDKHTKTYLQQRMTRNDAQEPLQPLPPALNDLIGEAIREYLSGERGDVDPGGLVLEDVAEGFKV